MPAHEEVRACGGWKERESLGRVATGVLTEDWVLADGTPGVEIAQLPVLSLGGPRNIKGKVTLRVDAGFEAAFGPGTEPWAVGKPTAETQKRVAFGRHAGAEAAKMRARNSSEPRGCYEHPDGGVVLSVKVSDSCPHDASQWTKIKCGHAMCKGCDGIVCPETKVCLKGPGPLIS